MSAAISSSDHVDAVDCTDCLIAVGLSSLEGNTWDGGVQLLSLTSGEVVQSMKRNTGVASIHFVGEEKNVIVAAGDDGSISLHKTEDISDAQIVVNAHNDCVSSICSDAFTPSLFTTAGWDGAMKIWDIYSNDLLKPVLSLEDAHQRPINGLATGKTGAAANNLFASVGQDGFLRLWDQRMGLKNGCAQIHNVMQAVSCVEWDNFEGHQVYIGTDSGHIGCYDIRQANQSWTALQRIHKGRVRRIRSAKSVPGVIFSASDDATIAVSDTSSLLFQDANIMHTSSSSNSTSEQAGISSLARYVFMIVLWVCANSEHISFCSISWVGYECTQITSQI